jgi:hypothetical protein
VACLNSLTDSPDGSEKGHSPPPFSPQDGAEGAEDAEGLAEEESLWDNGDRASPKVSLPSSRSDTGSNRAEGEDEARSVGGPSTTGSTSNNDSNNADTHQQSALAAHSAAATATPGSHCKSSPLQVDVKQNCEILVMDVLVVT